MRWVAHIDMDAFFASVEQLTRPTLRDRPVLVGGLGGRGVVAGASYEARAFGARSAMPMGQAVRLCNNRAVVVRPRKEVYAAASRRIFQVIRAHAGVVEQLSVDEGFAEPQGLESTEEARAWAENLQARVEEETGLPASVGMAATKLDAKMASDLAKPHGVFVVPPEARMEVFADRPVGDVWGIGKVAQGKLHTMGIDTIGQFVAADTTDVRGALGSVGVEVQRMAAGDDPRPVAPRAPAKQVSAERTLQVDARTTAEAMRVLHETALAMHRRLLKDGRAARTVTVKTRTTDFQLHTKSAGLPAPTEDFDKIFALAQRLMPRPEQAGAFRLVGVSVSGLVADRQELLFPELDGPPVPIAAPTDSDVGFSSLGDDATTARPVWHATQDVSHVEFGHGWVQGAGNGVVSVRFETAATGPGKTRTFRIDDEDLSPANPLDSLAWDLDGLAED
ncbi:DNA polymerase IV [Corynebacterium sp. HMSC08A12]|uniref:DNA polymerase IV n=1 Tax=Corynebacterium sp. HMSC08A12 TaxID=1581134 RepID=UPI0008A30447|nr:DNA polymerase IV [Corynebacterium sp. HMSC08A12]OFT32918.1 DNA polymerase IV [Corynebacterium sp. HMSC08A12]